MLKSATGVSNVEDLLAETIIIIVASKVLIVIRTSVW